MRQVPRFDPFPSPQYALVRQDAPLANAGIFAKLSCDAGRFGERS